MTKIDHLFYKIFSTYLFFVTTIYILSYTKIVYFENILFKIFSKYKIVQNFCKIDNCIFDEYQVFFLKLFIACITIIFIFIFIVVGFLKKVKIPNFYILFSLYLLFIALYIYMIFNGAFSFENNSIYSQNLTGSYFSFFTFWFFSALLFWPACMIFSMGIVKLQIISDSVVE